MGLWKSAPEEVRLEATVEDSQRWHRRDVVRQTVPNTAAATGKARSPMVDSRVRRYVHKYRDRCRNWDIYHIRSFITFVLSGKFVRP